MQKNTSPFFIFAIILSACSQNLWATPYVAPPATITLQVAGTIAPPTPTDTGTPAPTPTASPVLITSTPTVVVISPPEMQIDSTYSYADGTLLVAVPEGEFTMGGAAKDNVEHLVTLSSYWIYRTEVTKGQYARCVAAGKCTLPNVLDDDVHYGEALWVNDPVVGVSYDQANAYCKWMNASLPTEAQWEKAARGPEGDRFPWGDLSPTCDLLNYDFCVGQTTEVTQRTAGKSYYGALDMSGNVYEWVNDWYDEGYFSVSPHADPTGPTQGVKRVVRSSSFKSGPDAAQASTRFSLLPNEHQDDVGFRCAVNDPTYYAPMCKQVPFYGVNANGESTIAKPPNPKCADLSITMGLSCKPDGNPETVVTFNSPSLAVYSAPNCLQDSQLNIFTCYSADVISVCTDCSFPDLGQATCLGGDHYQVKDNACVWDGSALPGTQCADGYSFDAGSHCCAANETASNFCPAGYYFLEKQNACVPYPAQSTYCVEKTVELRACQ